jgi:hypothetical protein
MTHTTSGTEYLTTAEAAVSLFHPELKLWGYQASEIACLAERL